jgi:SLBB domain
MRRIIVLILIFVHIVEMAPAAELREEYMTAEDVSVGARGSEYLSGNTTDAVLMKVNVWGGVLKPGIHYVPVQTDLVTLFSYSGGPTTLAELDNIVLRRRSKSGDKRIEIDLKKLIHDTGSVAVALEPNDIIVIPETKPTFSNNTVQVLSVTASVISIILGYYAIRSIPK